MSGNFSDGAKYRSPSLRDKPITFLAASWTHTQKHLEEHRDAGVKPPRRQSEDNASSQTARWQMCDEPKVSGRRVSPLLLARGIRFPASAQYSHKAKRTQTSGHATEAHMDEQGVPKSRRVPSNRNHPEGRIRESRAPLQHRQSKPPRRKDP